MKMLMCGVAMSLCVLASGAMADRVLTVDGEEYPLSSLLENCQSITDDPEAQIACLSTISQLLEEQTGAEEEIVVSVPEALDALRAVAQYQDDDTGLSIFGADCDIHVVYYNNYFHISRRNISEIDLFSAHFDASKLQYDQIVQVQAGQALLSKGVMEEGATAAIRGGVTLDSMQYSFEPRSPRMTLADYAVEVVNQLPAREDQAFEFVLVHPQRSQASADIWSAFETFAQACDQ